MTTDLQILRGFNQALPATVAYASPPRGLQGTAKTAQRFASLFLREYDSSADRGTNFIPAMKAGRLRTDASIIVEFTAAAFAITRQLGDQSGLPASEQIAKIELLAHSLFSDSLSLSVRLTTKDGQLDFKLPIARV